MRDWFGRYRPLASGVTALGLLATGLLPHAVAQSNEGCFELSPDADEISVGCEQAADDPTILRYQASIAFANGARALLRQNAYASAASLIQKSYDGLSDADLAALPEPRRRRDRRRWREDLPQFRLNRIVTSGKAYHGLAQAFDNPTTAPGPTAICTTRYDCLNKGLQRLTGPSAEAAMADEEITTAQRNEVYVLRANLYEMRQGPTDFDLALADLRRVSTSGGAQKPGTLQAMEKVALSAGTAALTTGAGDPIRALGYFQSAVDANPDSAGGHAGLCEAHSRLGAAETYTLPQRAQEYEKAEPACVRATALTTGPDKASTFFALGDMRNALADLLEQSANPTPATLSRIQTLRLGATSAYESADTSTSNDPDQLLTLANAYLRSGNLVKAETSFGRAAQALNSAGRGRDAAAAYLEQADLRAALPDQFSQSALIASLSAAEAADRGSAEPVMRRGELLLASGNDSLARNAFMTVLGGGPASDRRDFRDIAEHRAAANYYLSGLTLNAATSDTSRRQAIEYADQAVLYGAGNKAYRELACLARIQRGGSSVLEDESTPLCMLGAGPSDHLLRGMLFMRRAQYTNGDALKRRVRGDARQALNDGLDVVSDTDVTQFSWPDAARIAPVRTRVLLSYLKELSRTCNDATDPFELPGVSEAERASAKAFLQFYKVRECRRH